MFGFGAVGDGVADDTDALQHALNDADGVLRLNKGTYRIKKPAVLDLKQRGFGAVRGEAGTSRIVMTGPGPALRVIGDHQGTASPASRLTHGIRSGFGVLQVHDLGAALRSKGLAFAEECKVFEVCNPGRAAKVLSRDMRLNMALPCRISVFTERGKTKLGQIKPATMLAALSQDAGLPQVAQEVEKQTIQMVDEAR